MIIKKLINNKALSKRFYSAPSNKGLLEGVRVLDLTRILAGPYCTMLLGDMGADVIKIERPTVGDDTRSWGPPFATPKNPSQTPESAYFLCVNRNKRSVTVDLKSPKGLQIIKDLVRVSDVLVENYIPGKLEEMGLGYETLKELNPKLVYASITGYGPDGPFAKTPGYDVMIEAEAGLMYITGHPEAPPAKVGVAITDVCTGLYAHGAILASLFARERTGLGQKVDLSLLETQLACLVNLASSHLIGGANPIRSGTSHPSIVPYQSFETKDGHIVVGAGNDKQFQKLIVKLDIENLKESSKFDSNPNRVKNRKELIHLLNEKFKENSTEYWLKQLKGGGFPFAPINDIEKTFKHPQVEHRKMIETVEHSTCGDIKLVGLPVKYSEVGTSIRLPPPTLGQHTQEVLKTVLNYNKHRIEELIKSKIV